MGNRIVQLQLKHQRERMEDNMKLAEEYQNHPVLGDKFLSQAVDAEEYILRLQRQL